MYIHEYQAKDLLAQYGIPAGRFAVARTPRGASEAARSLKGEGWVVKAQVHAGGRGKAGFVKNAGSVDKVEQLAGDMLGARVRNAQTGPEGRPVNEVIVTGEVAVRQELYVSLTVDSKRECVTLTASDAGGVGVEDAVRAKSGGFINIFIDPLVGLTAYQARNAALAIGIPGGQHPLFASLCKGLYRLFVEKDCALAEINPLALTADNTLLALDAKLSFDDNALFRHPDIVLLRDIRQENSQEAQAAEAGLSFLSLDGNIGCLINGAGLAMASMDAIRHFGAKPANFLDIGGGAGEATVTAALRILCQSPAIEGIIVNIFGGITDCETVAAGMIRAVQELRPSAPLVVRLAGAGAEQGVLLLRESGVAFTLAENISDAVLKMLELLGAKG